MIREAHAAGTSVADLAAQYDVSRTAIYNVLARPQSRRMQTPTSRVTAADAESIPYPDATKGYIPMPCNQPACGQPQEGPGHPRRGWVQLKRAGEVITLWFCSFHCVSRYAIRRELAGADAA